MSNALSVSIVFPRSGQLRFIQLPKELTEVKGVRVLEMPVALAGSELGINSEQTSIGDFSPRRSE